jgi:hypothetical protein
MSRRDPNPFAGSFDVIDAGLIILDFERRVRAWNEWMTIASGIDGASACNRPIDEVFPQAWLVIHN